MVGHEKNKPLIEQLRLHEKYADDLHKVIMRCSSICTKLAIMGESQLIGDRKITQARVVAARTLCERGKVSERAQQKLRDKKLTPPPPPPPPPSYRFS